jgi:molybdopterin-guanine dinucleotide biosynthesis protein A
MIQQLTHSIGGMNFRVIVMTDKISLVIQAGGLSRRMGEDKALKLFLGRPLIQRVVDRLAPLADEILVTTNRLADYAFLGLRLVPDLVPNCGSLGGLCTGIANATHSIVAVAACDMPFASALLFEKATQFLIHEGADVVVPRSSSGLEPMHAVYRRDTCLPIIRFAVQSNQLKAIDWFPRMRVREMSEEEIAVADPSGLAFWNINTLEDFYKAEQWCDQ